MELHQVRVREKLCPRKQWLWPRAARAQGSAGTPLSDTGFGWCYVELGLDSMVLMGPCPLGLFCDSTILFYSNSQKQYRELIASPVSQTFDFLSLSMHSRKDFSQYFLLKSLKLLFFLCWKSTSLIMISCFSSGRESTKRTRLWLWLFSPAVLAGWEDNSCGCHWYPALLRVLCLSVLWSRLFLLIFGSLLCITVRGFFIFWLDIIVRIDTFS